MIIQALYRATGQAYKPVPPKQSTVIPSKMQGFADKASKHGMDELIQADPINFDHDHLFSKLQSLTLDFRLNEPICSLVGHSFTELFKTIVFVAWDIFLEKFRDSDQFKKRAYKLKRL